jgi:hypothetical protein
MLDRALNEALRVHGGPAWRVFQVGCRVLLPFFLVSARLSLWHGAYGFCGCQELERRARDKYDAFDRVNAELHQL